MLTINHKAIHETLKWIKQVPVDRFQIDLDLLKQERPELNEITWLKGKVLSEFREIVKLADGVNGMGEHGLGIIGQKRIKAIMFKLTPEIVESSNNVFYSWQSDLDGKHNRNFIEDCIGRSIKQLKNDPDVQIYASLDKDTQNRKGAVDIANVIYDKIKFARAFVADVSIVGKVAGKPSPNPNVLLELGFAVGCLGWERVVTVCNEAYGSINELPFDLRACPITHFTPQDDSGKEVPDAGIGVRDDA